MMYDKFFDLKADALEERKERIRMGERAFYRKLKHDRGYIVFSWSEEVYKKLFPKMVANDETQKVKNP